MATARQLSTREQRKKLPARHEPYNVEIRRGLHLGYYRGRGSKGGSWILREFKADARAPKGGRFVKRRLGVADDVAQSDGVAVLTWFEALKLAAGEERPTVTVPGKLLVSDAADTYFLTKGNESGQDAYTYQAFIAPRFANRPINEITTGEIETWLASQVTTKGAGTTRKGGIRELPEGDNREVRRRGQATANRRYAVLRAILNSAYRKDPARVPSPDAWRRVSPFPKADKPRLRVMQVDEAMKLLAALPPAESAMARGALYTGCRLNELQTLKVGDVDADKITVTGKGRGGGKIRTIPLTTEGQEFFAAQCEGKKRTDLVFTNVYRVKMSRAMAAACKTAEIDPPVTFHDMRRSYGSLLINSGAAIETIQELLGHADPRMTRRVYAHLLQGTLKAAVQKHLPSFNDKPKPEPEAEQTVKPRAKRKRPTA